MRLGLLAAIYGLVAGAIAALVLWLMQAVSAVVWSGPQTRWFIFLIIMAGGALIAALRHVYAGKPLADQLQDLRTPKAELRRNAVLLAAMAIVAVGFGGAVGPEAGILAVISELSALISLHLARNNAEAQLLSQAGAAGALGGLYGSPPGGAVVVQDDPAPPRWQLYLAALTGLFGFLAAGRVLFPGNALRLPLPPYQPSGDGTELLFALIPALLGAGAALVFVVLLPAIQTALAATGGIVAQTLIGTALFAALAAALPILRFSGHHELEAMLHWADGAGVGVLMALALLKALALALCLAAGWRGGAIFPLFFIGAAAGAAALRLLPAMPETVALVAGMTAAVTAGMGKPVAAMLIALLLLGTPAMGAICVGAAIGWAASRLVPAASLH